MEITHPTKSLIKQNILLYLTSKGITPYEFYKMSGVTRGILQQNNGISEDNLAKFLAYASDVNVVWLLTGKGDMLLGQPTTHTPAQGMEEEATTINERFDLIISTLFNGKKKAFANAIGVTPSVVENIVGKRHGKPSFDVVEKISALADINISWLVTGKGEMTPTICSEPNATTCKQAFATSASSIAVFRTLQEILNEIAAHRKMIEKALEQADRLVSIIEKQNEHN